VSWCRRGCVRKVYCSAYKWHRQAKNKLNEHHDARHHPIPIPTLKTHLEALFICDTSCISPYYNISLSPRQNQPHPKLSHMCGITPLAIPPQTQRNKQVQRVQRYTIPVHTMGYKQEKKYIKKSPLNPKHVEGKEKRRRFFLSLDGRKGGKTIQVCVF
jgi:hypothetical protein